MVQWAEELVAVAHEADNLPRPEVAKKLQIVRNLVVRRPYIEK